MINNYYKYKSRYHRIKKMIITFYKYDNHRKKYNEKYPYFKVQYKIMLLFDITKKHKILVDKFGFNTTVFSKAHRKLLSQGLKVFD